MTTIIDNALSTTDLAEQAGVTFRMVDHWHRNDVLPTLNSATGSGHRRKFHPDLVPIVRTLGHVSTKFSNGLTCVTLRRIVDHYDDGRLDLGDGIVITWTL